MQDNTEQVNNSRFTKSPSGGLAVYGLIGFPLKHSFSSKFFTEKFERENIDAEYLNFEIDDILKIREFILLNPHLKGLNVTIPHKEHVIPFLDEISPEAEKIGAINVIKVERPPNDIYSYCLTGYNTDYIGFRDSIKPLINPAMHKKALVLGTGGAAKAVTKVFEEMNIDWKYVSRTAGNRRFTYEELNKDVLSAHTIIVNASPIGTFPNINECPGIPYELITSEHLVYDLVYNPPETVFLKKAKAQGATVKNGQEMLELQARAAWEIWNN